MLQELVIEDIRMSFSLAWWNARCQKARTVEDMVRDWLIATARTGRGASADLKRKSDSED